MIQLTNIKKSYQSGNEKLLVLNNINLSISKGDFVAIMGPSGSGKSTLINLIGFIDTKFEGEYSFEGTAIENFSDRELSSIRNKSVGFVFQNFSLIEGLTVYENIELPLLYNGMEPKKIRDKIYDAIAQVGLAGKENQYPKQLSGGQQQRVAIARSIINQPSFIIADEPTGALDSQTTNEIMELFKELNQSGVTIILVTHDAETALYCNRVIKVRDGEIIEGEEMK